MALAKLYLPVDGGGLAVPNMEHYYLAAQLQWVTRWLSGHHLTDTATQMPGYTQYQIISLFHPGRKGPKPTQLLLRVAHDCFRRMLRLTKRVITYAPAIPLLGTPRQHLATTAAELHTWEVAGLQTVGDLYSDGQLLSFENWCGVGSCRQANFYFMQRLNARCG